MENLTYIYTLEYPEGNIRYVGKANDLKKRLKRHIRESEEGTQTHKKAWINGLLKSGNKPVLNIIEEVTEENWSLYEQYWISQFKAWGFDLVNSTIGGDGYACSLIESREKVRNTLLSKYASGEIKPWNKGTFGLSIGWEKGKKQTKEHTEKARKTRNERLESGEIQVWNKGKTGVQEVWNKGKIGVMPEPWNKGTKGVMKAWNKDIPMSEESKKKCIVNHPRRMEVIQFDLNGNLVGEFISIGEAFNKTGINGISSCAKGKSTHASNFIWVFKGDYLKDKGIIKDKLLEYKDRWKNMRRGKGGDSPSARKVVQLDPVNKKEIKVWGSIGDAKEGTGKGNIGRACREGCKANGYFWKYLKEVES